MRERRPSYANRRNKRAVQCELCGEELEPGQGKVWKCRPEARVCKNPKHAEKGGWHVACLKVGKCRGRVEAAWKRRLKKKAVGAPTEAQDASTHDRCPALENRQSRAKSLASAEDRADPRANIPENIPPTSKVTVALADLVALVASDWTLPEAMREPTSQLVARCRVAQVAEDLVELEAPDGFTEGQLTKEPRWNAVHHAAAACIASSWEEHQRVELVLSVAERRAA